MYFALSVRVRLEVQYKQNVTVGDVHRFCSVHCFLICLQREVQLRGFDLGLMATQRV